MQSVSQKHIHKKTTIIAVGWKIKIECDEVYRKLLKT